MERAKQEAAEKARIETEARMKREVAEKAEKERLAAERAEARRLKREAAKPDQEKLKAFAETLLNLERPALASDRATQRLKEAIHDAVEHIGVIAEELGEG